MKRTNKKLKIKWKNVALLIVLIICASIIIHDVFMLTFYSWITGMMASWTWFGFLTFLLAFAIGGEIIEYFEEEINK